MPENNTGEMQATLGLTGLTMNAMALIAPGAFLWLTFYSQSSEGGHFGLNGSLQHQHNLQSIGRSLEPQSLSWALIKAQRNLVELGLRIARQSRPFKEILSQQPIGVFVGAALPRLGRVARSRSRAR